MTLTKEQLVEKYFVNYMSALWKHLNLPKPTKRQLEIAEFLQYSTNKRMVEAFRGIGKSYITSGYVTWMLRNDVDYRFLVLSASASKAEEFVSMTKNIINTWEFLKHLRGGTRDKITAFDVAGAGISQSPSVKALGITSQITGSRPNEIIADDIEVPNNSATEGMREKLLNAMLEFLALLPPEKGKITFLGTPQSFESIYNKLPERGFEIRIWPVKYPDLKDDSSSIYGNCLAPTLVKELNENPNLVGRPTEPVRFNELKIAEYEASSLSFFQLQYMLNTSMSDSLKYPLHTSDLIVTALDTEKAPISLAYTSSPESQIKDLPNVGFQGDRFYRPFFVDKDALAPYEGSVMTIDPSGKGGDELAYAIVKQLHGKLYVCDFDGLQGGYEESNLKRLAQKAKEHKVNKIIIESNFGDGMFSQLLRPIMARIYPCSMEDIKHYTQKETRIIDTLEPLLNTHKLIFDETCVRNDLKILEQAGDRDTNIYYSLFYQLTHITRTRGCLKHDDRLDALAMACNYWLTYMARDEEKAVDDYNQRMLDEDLKRFMDGALFVSSGGSNRWYV